MAGVLLFEATDGVNRPLGSAWVTRPLPREIEGVLRPLVILDEKDGVERPLRAEATDEGRE